MLFCLLPSCWKSTINRCKRGWPLIPTLVFNRSEGNRDRELWTQVDFACEITWKHFLTSKHKWGLLNSPLTTSATLQVGSMLPMCFGRAGLVSLPNRSAEQHKYTEIKLNRSDRAEQMKQDFMPAVQMKQIWDSLCWLMSIRKEMRLV